MSLQAALMQVLNQQGASGVNTVFSWDAFTSLTAATGGAPTTKTRSLSAWAEDNFGVYQELDTDEFGFVGARRVKNIITDHSTAYSDDLTTTGWSTNGTILNATDFRGASDTHVVYTHPENFPANTTLAISATVSISTGTQNFRFRADSTAGATYTATTTPTRFADVITRATAFSQVRIQIQTTAVTDPDFLRITNIQVERVGGRASVDQEPGEYQAVNASNNGIAVYSVTNPNTHNTSTGVVTVGSSSALTGMKGVQMEGSATNRIPNSNDLTTWSTSGTPTVTLQSDISPIGKPSTLISVDASNYVFKTVAASSFSNSTTISPQFLLKQNTASGTLKITNTSGAGDWSVDVSQLSTSWERVDKYHAAVTVNTAFASHTDGSAGIQFDMASGGPIGVYVAYAGLEQRKYTTSVIPTTGAAATRNIHTLNWGNVFSGTNNIAVMIAFTVPANQTDIAFGDDHLYSQIDGSNRIRMRFSATAGRLEFQKQTVTGGTVTIFVTGLTWVRNDVLTVCFRATSAGGMKLWAKGSSAENSGNTQNFSAGNFDIRITTPANSFWRKVRYWQGTLPTDSQLADWALNGYTGD